MKFFFNFEKNPDFNRVKNGLCAGILKKHDFVRPIDDQPQSSKQVINLSVF